MGRLKADKARTSGRRRYPEEKAG